VEGDLQRTFGRNVRALREGRGIGREQMAEEIGFHPTYLGAIERGERNLTLRSVERLCGALGMAPDRMLAAPAT